MAGPSEIGLKKGESLDQHTIQTMNSSLMGRATRLFAHMSGEKAKMLREIGFLCLRRIGEWVWLDEEFTFWLYRHLDTKDMCIKTSRATVIPVNDVDVSLVMGTQREGDVIREEKNISGEELCMLLAKLRVPEDKGCLDIPHLENIIVSDYSASSSVDDRDAFKIASVLYSWAMIFSISGTSPVIPYGLWSHLKDTSKIRHKNWSALILEGVRNAAISIQGGIAAGSKKFFITGCPLFLQVFYIDNLDYGMHTIQNTYLPRIYQFTQENMAGFVNMDRDTELRGFFREYGATRALPHDGVVYSRSVAGFVAENHPDEQGFEVTNTGQSSSLMHQLKEALKANQELLEKQGYIKKYHESSSSNSKSTEGIATSSSNISHCKVIGVEDARQKAIEDAFRKGSVYNVYRRFKSLSCKKKMGPCMTKPIRKTRFCREMVALKLSQAIATDMQLVVVNQDEPISVGGVVNPGGTGGNGAVGSFGGMDGIAENSETADNMDIDSIQHNVTTTGNQEISNGGDGTPTGLTETCLAPNDMQIVIYVGQHPVEGIEDTAVVPFESVTTTGNQEISNGGDGTPTGLTETCLAPNDMQIVIYVGQHPVEGIEDTAVVPFERVKWATYNSDYPGCPFDINLDHVSVDRKRSRALYRLLLSGKFESKVWFQSSSCVDNIFTGKELADKMKRGGVLCTRLCDAIIQSYASMDSLMYGVDRKHWEAFLPASFSEIVFGSIGDDYLNDERLRNMFTGDQLDYDFEHCRKVVAPVEFDQTYSCYIWDLSAMDCQVLDPVLMNSSEKKALDHHAWSVRFLTEALVKCVHKFFHGWRLLEGEWFTSVSTDISQKCRPYNSGVYALHYARWYDGLGLKKGITDAELGDIRADLLYQLVTMECNGSPYVASLLATKNVDKASSSGCTETTSSSGASTTDD